jgi:hypothetical protein
MGEVHAFPAPAERPMPAASQACVFRAVLASALTALDDKAHPLTRSLARGMIRATLEHPAMQPESGR